MKKLFEYTLGEVKEICERFPCTECVFASVGCHRQKFPNEWNLTEKTRFTEEEVETAKVLAKCFGSYMGITKSKNKQINLIGDGYAILEGVFPTLDKKEQFSITLKDIIENKGVELE